MVHLENIINSNTTDGRIERAAAISFADWPIQVFVVTLFNRKKCASAFRLLFSAFSMQKRATYVVPLGCIVEAHYSTK